SSLVLATLLMGLLGLSWKTALLVLAMPGAALAVAFWLLVRNQPEEPAPSAAPPKPIPLDGSQDTSTAMQTEPPLTLPRTPAVALPPVDLRRLVLSRSRGSLVSLGMLLVYAFASTFQDQLYVNWIPSFLEEGRGLERWMMGLVTPLPLLGGAVGSVLG